MRRVLLAAVCVLALPLLGRAAEDVGALRLRGADIGRDGVLSRKAADVMGGDGPTYTPLLVIDEPVLHGASRLTARVESFEVHLARLELTAVFPDGRRRTAEALDGEGRRLALQGTAPARPVSLAVPEDAGGATPVRLELAVQMLGPGVVSLSELRLETGAAPARAPHRVLGLAAAALALAAAVPLVARRRSGRRAAEARADQASAA
ncbi:MAG TPA: hypothetical protein VIN04_07000 [Myxococcota bacterium]